jgi:hypothetical protein
MGDAIPEPIFTKFGMSRDLNDVITKSMMSFLALMGEAIFVWWGPKMAIS